MPRTPARHRQPRASSAPRIWLPAALLLALFVQSGCVQRLPYPSFGVWNDQVKLLGPVSACQGGFCCPNGQCQWPLALAVPPPAGTYHRALVDDAVNRYDVPADEVVLKDVQVKLNTEVVGTVRGWSAEAIAGRRPLAAHVAVPPAASAPGAVEERLRQLDDLHSRGVVSDEEYKAKRAAILNDL